MAAAAAVAMKALPMALTAISAGGSLASGFGRAKAMRAEASAAEYRARGIELQGKQVHAERATELNDVLSTIDAIRSQRSSSLDSPSAIAFERRTKNRAAHVSNAEQLSIRQGALAERTTASSLKKGSKWALIGGFADAAGSLASLFSPMGKGGGGSSGGKGG